MLANLLGLLILVLLSILLAWITTRSWRIRRKVVKWPVFLLSGVIALIFGLASFLTGKGLYAFYAPRNVPLPQVTVEGSTDQVDRGEHIASYVCAHCHSTNNQLPLSGGVDISGESTVPVGSLVPFNLTPGGPLKNWSDAEIFRAVRSGVDRDGRPLIAMGSLPFRNLSDEDISAIIAYLRSQPAAENATPAGDHPNLLFALFAGANLVPKPRPVIGAVISPARGPTADYGKYIVDYIGCSDCHGPELNGGTSGGLAPVGPSLRPAGVWTQEQFIRALRTGVTPGGHALNPAKMYWKDFARMDDNELAAIHAYLRSLITGQSQ